ncbi:MAG: mandelate racemase/muconate lactonizing enzyme family protein [Candidatus Tectomicrobia bacterium]|uniref:Mandelate racemase/muconate lactonizing enzyme family protein n=1 Tax=Tectimicrobiota bacterium TaxID=2528274 RepID=A0A932I059_UNCTE|nr:mandelate racemase/muconate lactonizing enzyme family protein [Candidatus Tectomicrobia bacterium]
MASGYAGKPVRIKKVRTRFVSIPLERPLLTASFPINGIDSVLVDVDTDAGVSGIGWIFAFGRKKVRGIQLMIDDLGEMLEGEDALAIERCWRRMWNAVTFIGHSGAAVIAMSPIDTALWDIAAKVAGLPLYKLLGGARESVEAYASQGLWLHQTVDELQEEAASFAARGFKGVKMRVGKPDREEDIARVRAVREAVGPGTKLMVDVNQVWDAPTAIQMGRRLEEFDVAWIEEPLPYEDLEGCAQVSRALDTPVCTGETNYTSQDFRRMCELGTADILMPDLMRMGGVTEWMKAARVAQAFHLPVTPHLFMEFSSHLFSASPNAIWQEYQPWWEPVLREPVDFREGLIHLKPIPGAGFEWDEKAVAKYEVK